MAALNAVNAALANPASALRQAMERRERPALVHALAKLWKLPSSLVADLDATFGASAGKTFDKGAVPSATSKVLARSRIQVSSTTTKSAEPRPMPLSDVLHGGSEGWHHLGAPPNANVDRAARRAFERCLQRTLHAGLPIPLSWKVQWHALSPTGRFEAARIRGSEAGGHLSLLYDYEARDVPGSGTLPAGAPETRPRALEAALDDRTTTSFFRIKNSWGLVPTDPVQAVGRLLPNTPEYGDDDIEPEYGYHWAAEWTFYVVLPPGF